MNKDKIVLVIGENLKLGQIHGCRFIFCPDPRNIDLYADNKVLYYFSVDGWCIVDLVLWRCQFDKDLLSEQRILELVLQTNVVCINSALSSLLYCHNALMNYAISEVGLPSIRKTCFFGLNAPYMGDVEHLSKVLKVGEFHGGYGKALIDSEVKYIDTIDIATKLGESISLEDYIPYRKDIRILYIDGLITVYERVPSIWKANVNPISINRIDSSSVPQYVIKGTESLALRTNADIIGTDWILSNNGNWYILEANLSPGIVFQEDIESLSSLIESRLFSR